MRSADGVVARVTDSPPRRIELAFPVRASNLGLQPAFPALLARALDWLVAPAAERRTLGVGEPLRATVPAAATSATIRRPDGTSARVPVRDGRLEYTATDRTGRYEVEGDGFAFPFAVNLLDADESSVGRPPGTAVADAGAPRTTSARWRDVVPALVVAALVLLAVEAWLAGRRRGVAVP
jgi:hypothetical protein